MLLIKIGDMCEAHALTLVCVISDFEVISKTNIPRFLSLLQVLCSVLCAVLCSARCLVL